MYFELGRNDNGQPVPVLTGFGREHDVPGVIFTQLRSFEDVGEDTARALVHLLNQTYKAGYNFGFDGGYANGVNAGRRLERNGE